jgi:Fe-S-cluster containining protein
MTEDKSFPEGMVPLGDAGFRFLCHPGVSCFTVCCRNVDLDLYPYDIIRLKNSLGMDSETFMRTHTELKQGGNPYFPTVKLKLEETPEGASCPFLGTQGCTVYQDRPTACRTYPLERAVDRTAQRGRTDDFYFLTNHSYCKGHEEEHHFSVKQWLRNQRLDEYNLMNDRWAEVDTLFATNPWKGEGSGGQNQQLAFMVCYDIDGFHSFVMENRLLEQFSLQRDQKKRMNRLDEELLKFGFDWLKLILGAPSPLRPR